MAFDAEELKHMAAGAVSEYLNTGKTLNESISDMAVQRQLNTDQISRLVETANKVAYVKIMETASDRTGSFPLASVSDVNAAILNPGCDMQKAASATARGPLDIVSGIRSTGMEKVASEHVYTISSQEAESNLPKVASYFRKSFEKIAMEKESVLLGLIKAAKEVNGDAYAYAKIMAKGDDKGALLKVAQVQESADRPNRPFYDKELEKVAEFNALWNQAKDLISQEEALEEQLSKFASLGPAFINAATGGLSKLAAAEPAKRPLIGGLVGHILKGQNVLGKVIATADTIGGASLINKNPSVWQSLRG